MAKVGKMKKQAREKEPKEMKKKKAFVNNQKTKKANLQSNQNPYMN